MTNKCHLSRNTDPLRRKGTHPLPPGANGGRNICCATVPTHTNRFSGLSTTTVHFGGRSRELEDQTESFDLRAASAAVSEAVEALFTNSSRSTVLTTLERAKLEMQGAGSNSVAAALDYLLAGIELCLQLDADCPS